MPRPKRNEAATTEFAKAIGSAELEASAKDLELWAYKEHGVRVSDESLRKALLGQMDPTACAIEVLLILVGYFDLPDSRLGPVAGARLKAVRSLTAG
jgi:hypothetical protein